MKLCDFDYHLPKDLIAQHPLVNRSASRILILNRKSGEISHSRFVHITDFLREGDALILNNTKVFKARLKGSKPTGGKVEILLIREKGGGQWEAMLSPAKRVRTGTLISFGKTMSATIEEKMAGARVILKFNDDAMEFAEEHGTVPLPHYIKRNATERDVENYQTVFAKNTGSIAAPTAGLHFTEELLNDIRARSITVSEITLHIGPGTFKPIRAELVEQHRMDAEFFEISETAAAALKNAQRVFAVGTSVCRALETYARTDKNHGWADLFIFPGYEFQVVDCLVTNFHLPGSTPLLLVCAFAGKDLTFSAYEEAKKRKYRFLSYGDAMLII